MGLYIGMIKKTSTENGIIFNFEPIAIFEKNTVRELSWTERLELLPESKAHDILLNYYWYNEQECQDMDELFTEDSLMLFDFTLSDLEDNITRDGNRKPTGYKVSALKMIDAGKIHPIGNSGVYFAIPEMDVISDFTNDAIVDIKTPYLSTHNYVFIEKGDFWAGPYEVRYRDHTSSYYVKPEIKERKYTICGYCNTQVNLVVLRQWSLICPKADAERRQLDVIPDSVLIQSFRDSIKNEIIQNGFVKLDDVQALLQQYENSEISGSILTKETRRARLNKLVSIMSSEKDLDDTFHTINDFICDLLIKYKDSPNVDEWVQSLVQKNPHLLDQLQNTQAISKHITELKNKLDVLNQQRDNLEQEIEESRQRAEAIDHQAIEAKKKAMLEQEAEYAALSSRIEESRKLLGVVDSIDGLQRKYNDLTKEVEYLNTHKTHLDNETSRLELRFQQLISQQHEKMVEVAFDGFMASKILNAAAEWEKEQSNNQFLDFISKISLIPAEDKTPEDLTEYLCRMVRTCRPNYSKNTILNIAICMTQGFLTVFSGEPGGGKTSICNIMGEVLGLNKISDTFNCSECEKEVARRYVAVSVEKGWTSKRDFVGYYNPLSKTFDKSNRRIYDALRQLDTEKRTGKSRFPYVVLLDEANLSPMEYYWSDFMNVCDDLGPHSKVNLGEDYVFGIPETLHFVATINNDHTVETLSPRLIDRAWIITLPKLSQRDYGSVVGRNDIPEEMIEIISWDTLKRAFIPRMESCILPPDIQKCYDSIIARLREKKFNVSPRVDIAIRRYWATASKYFEMDDTQTAPDTIALDYAIAQRLLPKLSCNGQDFEKWLGEFRSLCSSNSLNTSAAILKDIIERGNQNMKYYQFFY